jgi:hypothetical protein
MKKPTKPKPKGRKPAEGDKRQFLTTMAPEIINNQGRQIGRDRRRKVGFCDSGKRRERVAGKA